MNMNRYTTNSNGTLVDTTPLFASIWLALFNVLRKNFSDRGIPNGVQTENSYGDEN